MMNVLFIASSACVIAVLCVSVRWQTRRAVTNPTASTWLVALQCLCIGGLVGYLVASLFG